MEGVEDNSALQTDSDVLKNNCDYQNLMKCFTKLQSQRIQAVKRLEILHETREKFIKNPRSLLYHLQTGENLDLPPPIKAVELPDIDWNKYDIKEIIRSSKPKTRKKKTKEELTADSSKYNVCDSDSSQPEKPVLVRGRIFDETKPQNFNQHWTLEEQRMLDELLLKYPDERISAKRWAKIAKELGTRTPLQVNSRIQKYFLALKREGLPVPGKNPRSMSLILAGKNRRKISTGRATFMKAFDFDEASDSCAAESINSGKEMLKNYDPKLINVSDEEDIADDIKDSKDYIEFMKLKKVKKWKLKEVETGEILHPGFECTKCGVNPIKGTRWNCIQCSLSSSSLDYCTLCRKSAVETESHLLSHTLTPINALSVEDTLKFL